MRALQGLYWLAFKSPKFFVSLSFILKVLGFEYGIERNLFGFGRPLLRFN